MSPTNPTQVLGQAAEAWRKAIDVLPPVQVRAIEKACRQLEAKYQGGVNAHLVAGLIIGAQLHEEAAKAAEAQTPLGELLGTLTPSRMPVATLVAACMAARMLEGQVPT